MKRIGLTLAVLIVAASILTVAGGYRLLSYIGDDGGFSQWLSVDPANVEAMVVDGPEGAFRLERGKQGWNVVHGGIRTRADSARVETLLDFLNNTRPSMEDDSFVNSEGPRYGLGEPAAKLTLVLGDGGRVQLRFGGEVPSSNRVYVWISVRDGDVYEMDARGLRLLSRPAAHFEDSRLLPRVGVDDLATLQLVMRYGAGWKISQKKENFTFDLPGYLTGRTASDTEVRLYVDSLSEMEAERLLPDETMPDRQPYLSVKVTRTDGGEESLSLFRGTGDAPFVGVSSWQPVPFAVNRLVVSQLVRTPFDMQGRRVVDIAIGDIHSIAVTFDGVVREAERTEKGWKELGGGNEIMGIDMSLWRLNEMKFEAMPLERVSGAVRESMTCILRDENGEVLAAMSFYRDPSLPEGQIWLRNGGGLYYPVSSQIVEDLRGLFPVLGTDESSPDA